MREVIIPNNSQPWSCDVNGVQYGPYPAGTVQLVPDEVAAVIDNYFASLPREKPPEASLEDQVMAIVRAHLSEIITDGSITTAKLADGAVTTAKLNAAAVAPAVAVTSTAPAAANENGLKFAVLAEEPATKYAGWQYEIKESAE